MSVMGFRCKLRGNKMIRKECAGCIAEFGFCNYDKMGICAEEIKRETDGHVIICHIR